MRTRTVNFQEVSIKETRRWKDPVTGKARSQTKKFWKTLNPFNKNADGSVRTRDEIMALLTAERDAWLTSEYPA